MQGLYLLMAALNGNFVRTLQCFLRFDGKVVSVHKKAIRNQ